MTKQQKTECADELYELSWFRLVNGMPSPPPLGRSVCVALIEQLYEIEGSAFFARFLAERLREPSPDRALLDMVASYLEPQINESFRLEAVRPRDGRRLTKSINDIALKWEVAEGWRALGNKHGSQKKVVKKVAEQFGVSMATVRKAIRSK